MNIQNIKLLNLLVSMCFLEYTSNVRPILWTVENMTARLTAVANASEEQANMTVNMDKTVSHDMSQLSQHAHKKASDRGDERTIKVSA